MSVSFIDNAGQPQSPAIRYGLVLVLILAGLVRFYAGTNLACISRDGVQFVTYAKQLAAEPIETLRRTTKQPGMPALMLAANRIAINEPYREHPLIWQACGQFVAFCGGVASCVLIMLLARRLFRDEWLALVAGLIACVWPQGVLLSGDVLSDTPHLALYLAALLVGYAAIERVSLRRLALCGALAGLAYLLRQEAMGVVAAVMICWVWCTKTLSMARRAAGVAVLALTFAVVVAPYPIAVGRIMPNKTIGELLWGPRAEREVNSPALSRFHTSPAMGQCHMYTGRMPGPHPPAGCRCHTDRWSGQLPDFVAQRARSHFGSMTRPTEVPIVVPKDDLAHLVPWYQAPARMVEEWCKSGRYVISTLVLVALFLRSCPRAGRTGARLVLLAVALQVIAVQLRVKSYGEISSRYLLIPAALCIPWAAAAMTTLVRMIAMRLSAMSAAEDARAAELGAAEHIAEPIEIRERRRLRSIWLSASIIVFAPLAYYATQPIGADKASYKQAGTWLRHNADPKDRIVAHDRLEQIMFYARRTWPAETWLRYTADDEELRRIGEMLLKHNPEYFLDAASSRRGGASKEGIDWEALEAAENYQQVWTSGDGPHEVRIYKRRPTTDG